MLPSVYALYDVIEATWPPVKRIEINRFILRDGAGGGKRVSAATAKQAVSVDMLYDAEAAMAGLAQHPLFMIREDQNDLDDLLEQQGYTIIDPVNIYAASIDSFLKDPIPPVTTYAIWEPLAVMIDIWVGGGIGPARIDVMKRVLGPKTSVFGRHENRPAGAGFVAVHGDIAMVHALEILPRHRRAGLGKYMMRQAAQWANEHGANFMSVVCTQSNQGANALYTSMGMTLVGEYHYRQKGSFVP